MSNMGNADVKTGRHTSLNFSVEEMMVFLNVAFRTQVSTF
jgi:hypothetical protein